MTTQIEDANELLRAALDIIRQSGESRMVAYEVETKAFGGGDGMCIANGIEAYLRQYDVPRGLRSCLYGQTGTALQIHLCVVKSTSQRIH